MVKAGVAGTLIMLSKENTITKDTKVDMDLEHETWCREENIPHQSQRRGECRNTGIREQ